ncbi:MAG: AgmX/PglI C-terminal domain-containing protein [Deltaproteobacteria bacterium]|nr:AgmX/PglI C-terminal domain-containing protein [Deltaproteobacteria bacterium]
MSTVALRTALIWHDEVMDDVVIQEPRPITIGNSGRTTFVVPNVGLPQNFAIVRPGNRGYLLTLGSRMRGTLCIDGQETSVEEFVQRGGAEPGGFHATQISGRDWGVIELDETGDHKLFFQFVPLQDAEVVQPFFTRKMMLAGLVGYLIASVVLGFIFNLRGIEIDEAMFRGACISMIPLSLAALILYVIGQEGESQASLAFSVVLHAYLLFWTYKLFDPNDNAFVYPGPRALTGQYLVTRLEDPIPEVEPPPTVGTAKKSESAAPKSAEKPNNAATKGAEGAAGGKGEEERARDKNATSDKPAAPKVAFFEDRNKKYLDNLIDRNLATSLDKFNGLKGDKTTKGDIGFGPGAGTGVGEGSGQGTTRGSKNTGTGGGGFSDQDMVRNKGTIDTGKNRPGGNCVGANCTGTGPKEVKMQFADPSGDFGGLTAEEIDRVVKLRAPTFRACYQKELNRTPGLGGKLVIKFKIGGDGVVQAASTGGGSTLRNSFVEDCVNRNVRNLKFPAKGGVANVNYPFVFSQGG